MVYSKELKDTIPAGLKYCDVSEFETVFRAYYHELYLFAYGYVMDEMEAEDIVQAAFVEIWERRRRLPQSLNIKAYLYTSVKHGCLHYFKRLKLTDHYKKRQAEALLLSFASEAEEDDQVIKAVKNAMEQLTEQQALIVKMHIQDGLKYSEIAEILHISENTVRTHLKRAYRVLRDHLSFILPGLPLFVWF